MQIRSTLNAQSFAGYHHFSMLNQSKEGFWDTYFRELKYAESLHADDVDDGEIRFLREVLWQCLDDAAAAS